MPRTLLLEIGTEEIPARFMKSALAQLKELAEKTLLEERIDYTEAMAYGTPRRLALIIKGVAEEQQEKVEEVKGPAKKAAFDAAGLPTKAAQGFARSQGVAVDKLEIRTTPAGEYLFAIKQIQGRPTVEVLIEKLPELITSLSFPKPMRWGYGEMRFARPIHWLVALYGQEVVPFTLAGLTSGRITYGHRFLGQGAITLAEAEDYLPRLEENFVIADQEKRRSLIWQQIQELARQEGGRVEPDEELLEEVTHLLEYPTALCGCFADHYLELPEEVLITPMREHQRYFPVRNEAGQLLSKFITVRNGTADHLEIVREGNEKVLRARLADARFFFEEDLKVPLEQNIEKLGKIVFQESLGMVSDKVQRIRALAGYLAQQLAWPAERLAELDRAALLAKTDLVTNMVYEFPELQGIMGAEYARRGGEPAEVAQAIFEHYLPRQAGDILPATELGMVVSLADKFDTITGCFAVGIQPTGSQDPYALRRQALGICRIMLDRDLEISLSTLIEKAYRLYTEAGQVRLKLTQEQVTQEILEFFKQRLRNILSDRGIAYDVLEAVLAVGFDNLPDLKRRADGVQAFRQRTEFADLITAYTRANNLARHADTDLVDESKFVEPVEGRLFGVLVRARAEVQEALQQKDISRALESVATLREPIGEFFEGVMVMVEDQAIRQNRLGLLKLVSNLAAKIADFSRLVGQID
ncbi:MAG: glycine--tRNA ligase subunit beta [Bacillota bacterium]|jgi:glycyl-tRNA synthetase beta chain